MKSPIRGDHGGTRNPKKRKKKKPINGSGGASTPGHKKRKKKKGGNKKAKRPVTNRVLNPPFDARMRKIGSPLNQTMQIKRGWIQDEESHDRVNFLFNPSQLDLSHGVDPQNTESPLQGSQTSDVMSNFYTASASTLTFKLLYDRTYELFSRPGTGAGPNAANKFGMFADVAAWYELLGMLEARPATWDDTFIIEAPQLRTSYLFIGPRLVYYGWVTGIAVTYSHWTQNMIPSRGAIDVSFQILPYSGKANNTPKGDNSIINPSRGWGSGDLPEHGGMPSGYNPYSAAYGNGPSPIKGGGYVF